MALNETDKQALDFRMLGTNYQLHPNFMKNMFSFAKNGIRKMPSNFHAGHFWALLTDLPPYFNSKKGLAMFIKDHKFWILHKILTCLVFGKSEGNQVSTQELFLMWCIHEKKPIYWHYWVLNQLFD